MILEGVVLFVKKGKTKDFELDFIKASQYISAVEGYLSHTLQKCLEIDNKYLLLVEWNTLESHTIGFRESSAYLQWKELLHHYYEPFPTVEHFKTVYSNKK